MTAFTTKAISSNCCHKIFTIVWRNFRHDARNPIPVITVPKYIEPQVKKYENTKKRLLAKKELYEARRGNRNCPVITSKHIPQFNHYLEQTYARNAEVPLASKGWKNGKHKGDVITFHPRSLNPHFEESNRFNHTFKVTQLSDRVVEALDQFGYVKPTTVQLRAIPCILRGQNVICSAETGSGKTLAYLAPIMDKIVRQKEKFGPLEERHPMAMVVLPTRELVQQIGLFARELGSKLDVGVAPIIGGLSSENVDMSHTGYDMIVTTIGLIGEHSRSVYSINRIKTLVLDEADTLLDDTFSYGIWDILQDLKFKSSDSNFGTQMCIVSATVPSGFKRILGDYVDIDSFARIETENLHRLQPHVKHIFLRIHKFEKPNKILEIVAQKVEQNRRMIIFCGTRGSCEWLSFHLKESGFKCSRIHKRLAEEERYEELKNFQTGEVNILVTTDLGSRGLDVKNVSDVINYDAPHHVSDYIHRSGRTGRVGCRDDCTVTTLVSFKPEVDMLNKLEYSVRKGVEIENVNGNIRSILKQLTRDKFFKLTH